MKDDIIEPLISPWKTQVLVVTNEHHKRQVVFNNSQAVSRYTHLDVYPLRRIDGIIDRISRYSMYGMHIIKNK